MFYKFQHKIKHRNQKGENSMMPQIERGKEKINSGVLVSHIGLLCMGRANYEDIELFRHDEIFRITLGLKTVPSSSTLRQRPDAAKVAFDPLRMMGGELLASAADLPVKLDLERRRLKSVIMNLVMAGCTLVGHANRLVLKTGDGYAWFESFRRLYLKLY